MLYHRQPIAFRKTTHSQCSRQLEAIEKNKKTRQRKQKVHPPDNFSQAGASPLKLKSKMPMIVERSEYV